MTASTTGQRLVSDAYAALAGVLRQVFS